MKKMSLLFLICLSSLCFKTEAQGFVSANPDSVAVACPSCPGADWSLGNPPAAISNYPFSVASVISGGNTFSKEIQFYDYDLAIPLNSTVSGVEIDVIRMAGGGTMLRDSIVKLMVQGQAMGTNAALQGNWSFTTDTVTYGSPFDTWGINLSPANINGNQMGISFVLASTNATVAYYKVLMRVYYTFSMGGSDVQKKEAVFIYPNPAQKNVQLELPAEFKSGNYEILDASGRFVELISLESGKNSIDIHHLSTGTYHLMLGDFGRKTIVKNE